MSLRGAIGERASGPRKADRLPPAGEANAARQVIRVSMTTAPGNREVVRVRPFVRVSSNLAMSVTELSANIPPFNAQKMLADADSPTTANDNANAAEPDAEVSFVQRDLAAILPRAKIAGAVPMDEVLASVREAANWTARDNTKITVAGLGAAGRTLAYAAEGTPDPYAGFEARIVPENITLLPKTASQVTGGNAANERTILVKKGDSIASILRDLGALPDEIRAIASALGPRGRDNGLKEGQRLRILQSAVPGSERLAAGPRDRGERIRDRSRDRAVRSRPLRVGRRQCDQHLGRGGLRRRRGGRRHGRAALSEHLRDRVAQPDSARR